MKTLNIILLAFLLFVGTAWGQGSTGWSEGLLNDQALDATATVTTSAVYVGHTNIETIGTWFKADENTGTVDVLIEYQFKLNGMGWGSSAADADTWFQLDANNTTNELNWYGINSIVSAAWETPGGYADSLRYKVTGNAGNGADIDVYLKASGSWD